MKPNRGSDPMIATKVAYDTTEAISEGSSASCARSSRYGISRAKISPVRGARNTAAIPAAAPLISITRRSESVSLTPPIRVHSHDPMLPPP